MQASLANDRLGSANSDHVPLPVPTQPREHRNRRVHRIPHKTISVAELRRWRELGIGWATIATSRGRRLAQPRAWVWVDEVEPDDYQLLEDHRPKCRADCRDNGLRPCPFVSCRHNLYLDVCEDGAIELTRPELEPGEMEYSCVLDLVDGLVGGLDAKRSEDADGPVWSFTLEPVGVAINLTRERARQIEKEAEAKLFVMRGLPRPEGDEWQEERSVCKLARLQLFMSETGAKAQIVHAPGQGTGPRLDMTCSKCGKSGTRWFQGWTLLEIRVMAGVICSQPSECCGAPITSRLDGMPAALNRRYVCRDRDRRTQITEALRQAGADGLSLRQLCKRVPGRWAEIAKQANKLAADRKSHVQRRSRAPGEPERFFCTLPATAAALAT